MKCPGCDADAKDTVLGLWCDDCGGVVIRKTESGKDLLFRHVATVDGAGGRFPIVFDYSTADYSVSYPREVKEFIKIKDEWVQSIKTFTTHGDLNFVIAVAQPYAKGVSDELPELSVAPSATKEEREVVNP